MIKHIVVHSKQRVLNDYAEASYIMAKNDLKQCVIENPLKRISIATMIIVEYSL